MSDQVLSTLTLTELMYCGNHKSYMDKPRIIRIIESIYSEITLWLNRIWNKNVIMPEGIIILLPGLFSFGLVFSFGAITGRNDKMIALAIYP